MTQMQRPLHYNISRFIKNNHNISQVSCILSYTYTAHIHSHGRKMFRKMRKSNFPWSWRSRSLVSSMTLGALRAQSSGRWKGFARKSGIKLQKLRWTTMNSNNQWTISKVIFGNLSSNLLFKESKFFAFSQFEFNRGEHKRVVATSLLHSRNVSNAATSF